MFEPEVWLPIILFVVLAFALPVGMLVAGWLFGPSRQSSVKAMPYESGMTPFHDSRRRFNIRFYLIAIAFLVFDVELLFLYPWAVAAPRAAPGSAAGGGIDRAIEQGLVSGRGLVFADVMVFIALLALGFTYAWRKGVFRWR